MCEAIVKTLSSDVSKDDEMTSDFCWICYEAGSTENPLISPCKCRSRQVHHSCLARWQLQQAGRTEERSCRFCHKALPDWRDAFAQLPTADPVMTIVHSGQTHMVTVAQGKQGRENFQKAVRKIFNLSDNEVIQLTFGCKVPGSDVDAGAEIVLEGWESFDAAVHCAAISAGQRMRQSEQHAAMLELSPPPQVEPEPDRLERRRSSGAGMLRRLFSRPTSQQNPRDA